jgi:(p)ppGpp synthase/HD superfamily hydrolase
MTLSDAIIAAARLHEGQVDKAGAPYILHPLRVMLAMRTEEERILAVLHDTAEDAGWKAARAALGALPAWLEEGLDALTRRRRESYQAFIARAAENPLARRVKLADLADNMDPSRIPAPTEKDSRRLEKYHLAQKYLLDFEAGERFTWTEEDFASGGVYFSSQPPGVKEK